jgi:hypothetical protein
VKRITFSEWMGEVCTNLGMPQTLKKTLEANEWWLNQFKQGVSVKDACGKYLFARQLP